MGQKPGALLQQFPQGKLARRAQIGIDACGQQRNHNGAEQQDPSSPGQISKRLGVSVAIHQQLPLEFDFQFPELAVIDVAGLALALEIVDLFTVQGPVQSGLVRFAGKPPPGMTQCANGHNDHGQKAEQTKKQPHHSFLPSALLSSSCFKRASSSGSSPCSLPTALR